MTDLAMTDLAMTDLDRLLMRLEIEALISEFAYRIDFDRSHEVADLFTPDGCYGRAGGGRSVGRAAIGAAYAARHDRGPRTARHSFSNLRLTPASRDRATGTCLLTLFAADGLPPHPAEVLLVADYHDTYVRDADGQWRFAERIVTHLFTHPTAFSVVLPLGVQPLRKATPQA